MKLTGNPLWRFLGFNTQGDLGPYTFYTSHDQGLVIYLSTSPKKPQSARQRLQRNHFKAAGELWQHFTLAERALWEEAAHRARLRITGFNAWVHIQLRSDESWYASLCRAAGMNPPLTPVAP